MKTRLWIVLVLPILYWGCANTKVTSFKDPEFATTKYSRILVMVPFADLESMQIAERAFADECASKGIRFNVSGRLLPPTRKYADAEIESILRVEGIDAVLVVSFTDSWTDQTYVPQSSTSVTSGQANAVGNTVYYKGVTNTTNSGGYYVSKPRVSFRSELIDAKTARTAWVATSVTKGNAFAKFVTLMRSLASSTVEQLIEDGLLRHGGQ